MDYLTGTLSPNDFQPMYSNCYATNCNALFQDQDKDKEGQANTREVAEHIHMSHLSRPSISDTLNIFKRNIEIPNYLVYHIHMMGFQLRSPFLPTDPIFYVARTY